MYILLLAFQDFLLLFKKYGVGFVGLVLEDYM